MLIFFATVWATSVFCGTPADGAYWDGRKVVIPRYDCITLSHPKHHFLNDYEWWVAEDAVFVLAHELGHAQDQKLRDGFDIKYVKSCSKKGPCEAQADCFAAGHMTALARTLGFSGYKARHLRYLSHGSRSVVGYETIPQRCWTR